MSKRPFMASTPPSALLKQGNGEDTLSPVVGKRQISCPTNVPPLHIVSPLSQDLWHLPGMLRINPSLWDKEDVALWLHWAQKEYSLQKAQKEQFEMNGRALCLLTKEDFRRRCPSSGDVLYEILQCVKQQRRSVVCETPNVSSFVPSGHTLNPSSIQMPSGAAQEQQSVIVSDRPVSASFTTPLSSPPETPSAIGNHPALVPHSVLQTHNDGSPAFSAPSQNLSTCVQQTKIFSPEPLNLSNRERPRSPLHKANGRIPECRLLWDYVYQLLCDDRYRDYIRWEDEDSLVFRVVDPNGLARLWGNHKNRENMTYEKMSRALRHYYKLNIIKKEHGQKLLFRFLKLPWDIGKQQRDGGGFQEHTPPEDTHSSESSPVHEFSEEHFEVSPDRASPHSPALVR